VTLLVNLPARTASETLLLHVTTNSPGGSGIRARIASFETREERVKSLISGSSAPLPHCGRQEQELARLLPSPPESDAVDQALPQSYDCKANHQFTSVTAERNGEEGEDEVEDEEERFDPPPGARHAPVER